MLRFKYILLFFTLVFLYVLKTFSLDVFPPTVEPGKSITNNTTRDIYIIIKLHPKDSFQNNLIDTATVYSEAEFLKRFYYYKLHSCTEKYDYEIDTYEKLLNNLDADINRIQQNQLKGEK